MTNCCEDNGCVEKVPSGCVIFTGSLTENSYLSDKDYCNPNLNTIVKDIDDELTRLDTSLGLDKTAFDVVNSACGITPVLTGLTEHSGKYYSSEVVMKLVTVICELRSRLNVLTTDDSNTNPGNKYLLDIALDNDFKNWLAVNSCLGDDPCTGNQISDLRGLLQAMIVKLCNCCS